MAIKDNSYGIAPLQDKMLALLKALDEICEKNNLRYWVAGGTCIGVLRHQGFIPWDDDLDVYMPRPDYEKLWQLYENTLVSPDVKLCRTTKEHNYHHRVMQLVDLSTTFINRRNVDEDIEHGVYIDIIPLDAKAKGIFGKVSQLVNAIFFSVFNLQCKQEFNVNKMTKLINFGTEVLLKLVRKQESRFKIWKKAEQKMSKYDWNTASEAVVLSSTVHELFTPFPMEWFGDRRGQFEDTRVRLPDKAEEYCKVMYGDYMELPPLENRKVRHNTVLIDLDKSYTAYKGSYYCVKK